jgi:hypothetical protein
MALVLRVQEEFKESPMATQQMTADKVNTKESSSISTQGWLLKIENGAIAGVALALYAVNDYSWILFVLLFLLPDLAMLGYLLGNRVGAMMYNVVHMYATPLVLGALAWLLAWPLGMQLALIWIFHIAVDRVVGYGLKYESGFKQTHLDRV